jgi:outer membrane protein assembly factor BamE
MSKPLQWIDHNPPAADAHPRASALLAMPVSFAYRFISFAAVCASLSACSTFDNATGRVVGLVSTYKVDVVQGNFVSKEQKDALQIGMPRAQVREILGSPLLSSAFHADRWEYVFTIRRQGQEPQQRKLTTYFKDDALVKVDSDALISEEEFVTALSGGRSLRKVPVLQAPPQTLPAAASKAGSLATSVTAPSNEPARVYPPLEPAGR